jgi:hypothetical protein
VEAGSLETMRALASDSLVKNESEQGYVMAQHNADQVADWNGLVDVLRMSFISSILASGCICSADRAVHRNQRD